MSMKQVILVAAAVMALMVAGCGEDKPRQPEVNSTTTTTQKADDNKPGDTTKTDTTTTQNQ